MRFIVIHKDNKRGLLQQTFRGNRGGKFHQVKINRNLHNIEIWRDEDCTVHWLRPQWLNKTLKAIGIKTTYAPPKKIISQTLKINNQNGKTKI